MVVFYVFGGADKTETIPNSVIGQNEHRWEGGTSTPSCLGSSLPRPFSTLGCVRPVPLCSFNSPFFLSGNTKAVVDGFTSKGTLLFSVSESHGGHCCGIFAAAGVKGGAVF